ncbi:hypothetical protein EV356DRAFT_451247 [Viridothelium virens]|uniref:Myosin type II heavy chain n=1 Tax=Viridothelium virens TaxID=1048519 RepID=A0A6A6H1S5_VIRVR|nr:hypothetical protein EV356DRAFT_451247 [Viridothelium virens]
MSAAQNGPRWRNSPFSRDSASPSPAPSIGQTRPKSMVLLSPSESRHTGHLRSGSSSLAQEVGAIASNSSKRMRSGSGRGTTLSPGTFAPQFIKLEDAQTDTERVRGIEGENDFSGKRYVWLRDEKVAFVKGWILEDLPDERLSCQLEDGSQREVHSDEVDKVNPAKFDKADDMAELTHLNEPSVVHNLSMRYQADLIYTYSGLFLVAVNPYCPLPIYTREYINMYRGRSREDTKPHIFAMADEAFRNLVEEGENQSILVTGESGAGKTENTKKVIQYLAAVATTDTPRAKSGGRQFSNLSEQILRANPILEAFGNAQTVRNNNSSRFGKFIRIEFTRSGQIAGAFIDWYLLEKSRVVRINSNERNYHVFYQLLRGADRRMKDDFLLANMDIEDFVYTKNGNDVITGVSDQDEWNCLIEAFHIMAFSDKEQTAILRTMAGILHLGNVEIVKESLRGDQAALGSNAMKHVEKFCRLLGVEVDPFLKGLLHPRVKAGREWVEKVQTPEQVRSAIDALAKGIYERSFGDLVDRINRQLDRKNTVAEESHFIGVLDIAGFEIFDHNSFEQLCINYTNEKLQQFFNHHMFVLEQEEYAREQIEWKFIDFGKDLQPTIDLIELPNPIGIFSCLDEDSVMPKATDKTFTEKLHSLWDRKTLKYKRSLLNQGFMLTHYAADVEYSTDGWLEKNKDPINDNVTRLLAASGNKHIAQLFADCAEPDEASETNVRSRVKKGLFRTVAQRHKEQLSQLMGQLHSTHPHFVRCILPNHKKRPKQFSASLVLDQLRCNGVLEGIRIARTGFPNRLPFAEFRARYEVLCSNMPKGYVEGQEAAAIILEKLNLDKAFYRVGLTKVFFRAGVLAELEEQRDALISEIMSRFQSVARGFTQRRIANKRLYRAEATRIIQRNMLVYGELQASPWWRLFVRMRPLLGATMQANEVKKRDEMIQKMQAEKQAQIEDQQRIEDERRRTETELQRMEQTLESERALALDKEEIFKRLQERESELGEKLAGALEDQESLEQQLDELMEAKKNAEEELSKRITQLEQAGLIISKLEADKGDLAARVAELEEQMEDLQNSKNRRSEEEDRLNQEIRMLKSQVGLKERKLEELEKKLLKSDQDLDIKLAASEKELQGSRKQVKELLDENRQIRQQMSELSSTSTSFEDVIRRKESELAILKADAKKYEGDRQSFELEKKTLGSKHDSIQRRLREVQAETEGLRAQKSQLEREVADAKRMIQDRTTENEERKMLESQVGDLRSQLVQMQTELSRERQSRDDVQMLGDHNLANLKREYESLNEAKIIIEKEMYVQQDVLRRATEARTAAEGERKEFQNELRGLRDKFLELQQAKLDAEAIVEERLTRQASERHAMVQKDLNTKERQLADAENERSRLTGEVQKLKQVITDSDLYKLRHDQDKERLERELVTIKGRLTASENDNRALLNKVQQKNLDIARSNSRASDSQRSRLAQLTTEKAKTDEENKKLLRQLEDSQLTITSLEKQKEKLSLNLEDLNHEINREHKTTRNAEKSSSTVNLQLAEANRKLETERQLRNQAQTNSRTIQSALDNANNELSDCHNQLMLLQKVFSPDTNKDFPETFEAVKTDISKTVNLAQKLENSQQELRRASERASRAEGQLDDLRERFQDDLTEIENRHGNSKRALLEEMNANQVNSRQQSPVHVRRDWENKKVYTPTGTPTRRHISEATHDSARSDRTVDTVSYNNRMDMAAELEMVQNQLQMSEMRNRHLQSQIDRSPSKPSWQDDSPSVRRVQKLERENSRLHDMLDDSAKKVSSLENSIRTGQLSLQEVATKSHEELYDLITSQESSRRSLLQAHNTAVSDLAEAKTSFDDLKQSKVTLEVELRDARSELADTLCTRDQEEASHAQLLQEFSALQIRLDGETSALMDAASSLNLYKARADEYFSKLETAELAVLKASRAEQFARTQARETEEACATALAERQSMEAAIEELQRGAQQAEERIEDLGADLEGALQAKRRLQNELEDYRSQRAIDIEDRETGMEQTRKKYQAELSALSGDLDIERENVVAVREENGRLREELEELRGKWDDEVLNSSSWAKEKSRLEMTLQDIANARDEAVNAHHDAQSKIVNLLSQVRGLRTAVDEASAERDNLLKEKKGLETRLQEAGTRLEELAQRGDSPGLRNAAEVDRELLDLKSGLAQQEDIAAAAVGKMRRAEALAQEIQKDIVGERESNVQLHKEKAGLERQVKDLQLKCVDLETKGYKSVSGDVRFLHGRIQELEKQLESESTLRANESRTHRTSDRTLKDLNAQLARKDKSLSQLASDLDASRAKISRLLASIDELQQEDSAAQLSVKRAERDLREEREKGLRLERELEGWKGLRMERESVRRSGTLAPLSDVDVRSRRGSLQVPRDRDREGSAVPTEGAEGRNIRKFSGNSFL